MLTLITFFLCQGYMMDLTSHQGRVGNVLQLGSQLIGSGKLSEDEETEVQEQMNLLNSRWVIFILIIDVDCHTSQKH